MKKYTRQFGGKLTPSLQTRYAQSPQWKNGKFENLEETRLEFHFQNLPKLLRKQFCEREGREPKADLPIISFDRRSFLETSGRARFIWYGHSALLMRMNGQTLLIDPMLGPSASPIAPFTTKRYSRKTLDLIDDFPEIDLVLLTHDHYDHLDYDSIRKLKPRVKKYFVALGVARHLIRWGIPENDITEFDWWDHQTFNDIQIAFTPTRHFSGRGLHDRAKSLWGGWTFKTPAENIYFSGDSGYGAHFRDVGARLGPFDFAFMECGQYNENWHAIHMYPEESVQAAVDAQARRIMPVHWAGFSLSIHPWKEPAERFTAAALRAGVPFTTPPLGQVFSAAEENASSWWKSLE